MTDEQLDKAARDMAQGKAGAIKPATMDRVILRRYKTLPNEVIAFLPDCEARPGNIVCYQHVGQHGEASLEFYRDGTTPIKGGLPYDALALLAELRNIGYVLQVAQRR